MKILIIAATHGNELLGIKLYQHLLTKRSPVLEHVDFIIGNPRAYVTKKRYIDVDLNRSYQSAGTLYEERRAREIKQYITVTKPDIILDMHTTTCVQPNCLIVANLENKSLRHYLAASHIDTILQIKPMGDIASCYDNAIGYEVPNTAITPALLDNITKDLEGFINNPTEPTTKQVYTMTDKIYKKDVSESDAASFVNFQMHTLGFVPIMTGENSYKKQTDYLGFKTDMPTTITL